MSVIFSGEQQYWGEAFLEGFPRISGSNPDLREAQDAMARIVGAIDPGTVLLDQGEFKQIDELGLKARFVEDPELSKGRQQSAHGLYAGQMVLDSASDHERPELVAVKLYENDPRGAIHELTMNSYVNGLDARHRAFRPLGLWKDGKGNLNVLTRYEHGVQSYDNILWADPDNNPGALEAEKIRKAVRMSMFGIGLLHGLGLQHGDAQAKNLGTDNEKVRFIDLETASGLPRIDGDPNAPIETGLSRELVVADLETFLDSCFRNQGYGPDDDGNILEVSEAMLDIIGSSAVSYQRGVCRALKVGKDKAPEATVISQIEIQVTMNRFISTALESLDV